MEVLVGPTFTIENPSSPTTDRRRLFLNGINEVDQVPSTAFRRISARCSSESSSSIGTPDDSDNDDEEVQSDFNLKTTNANAFSSLEDSLPIKKGLSSHFDGKSKSFTDLSKVNSLNELNKQESPFNKRRRVLIASKFSRITRSSFYSWSNPQSMPLLPLDEEEDLDNNYYYQEDKARKLPYASSSSSSSSLSEDKKQQAASPQSHAAEMRLRLGSFNSRSFSLADLKEHDDDDEDNDHED